MPDKSKTTDLDEDAVEVAAMAIWEEYPAPLPAYASIPELSLDAVSRGDLRRMARAAIRAYLGRELMSDKSQITITREQWRDDHDMQAAEIERLRAALKGHEVMLTHFENVFLEAQAKLREVQNV